MWPTENIKNIKECKCLIKGYKQISIEDIISLEKSLRRKEDVELSYPSLSIVNKLLGFGHANTCKLCDEYDCSECIHSINPNNDLSCTRGKTYRDIVEANDAKELLAAVKNRAKYLESLLRIYYREEKERKTRND